MIVKKKQILNNYNFRTKMIYFRISPSFLIKYTFLLVVSFFTIQSKAQLSAKKQLVVDSLYPIAQNSTNSIDTRLKAYNRCSWATIYQDYNQGLKISSEYLALAKSSNDSNRIAVASHFLGYTQMMLGQFDEANKTILEGLEVSIHNNDYRGIAELYGDLGNLKNKLGQTREALNLYNKGLDTARKHDVIVEQARANINIGKIHENQGNYKLGLATFQEALSICNKNNFGGFKSSIYEHLGDINVSIKEFETADKHYKKALEFSERFKNFNRMIQSLNKLGKLNQELNQLDSALNYYNKALTIASDNNIPVLEAKVRTNLANVNLQLKKYKQAATQINTSINLYNTYKVKEDLDVAFLVAAQVYDGLNQRNQSKYHYQKAYELARQTKNINTLKNASKGLAMAFETEGNQEKSIKYYKEYIQYSNQERDEDGIKEIIRLKIQDDYRQKTIADSISKINEIKLLEAEHDKKEAQSNLKTYIAFSGIGILSLGLIFVGYSFIQKRKSATILTKKNKIISQALSDNEILLKEVHHRVKNNMQVVSSILQLKAKNTDDELAKMALLDSQKRIHSMQMAHQKMYQKGNYKQIDIIEYYKDILNLLLNPIKGPHDIFKINGESLWIDVEQAQALGFIIHELITNSIKYAWDQTQPKRVEIDMLKSDNSIEFQYSDNGKGMPADFDISTTKSFGMKLIHSIATRQLLGTIELKNKNGFNVKLKFNERQQED